LFTYEIDCIHQSVQLSVLNIEVSYVMLLVIVGNDCHFVQHHIYYCVNS